MLDRPSGQAVLGLEGGRPTDDLEILGHLCDGGGAGGRVGRREGRERLAQDLAVDLLDAAKNGGVEVFIVKAFILSIVKARAGNDVSPPRLPPVARKRKAPLSLSTPLPLRRPLASSLSFPCPCGSACAATCWPGWRLSAAIGVRVLSVSHGTCVEPIVDLLVALVL